MTDLRTAAQRALDDLRDLHANHNITYAGTISRLEAALAQQAEPVRFRIEVNEFLSPPPAPYSTWGDALDSMIGARAIQGLRISALAQKPQPVQEICPGCEATLGAACGRESCPKGWEAAPQPQQAEPVEPVAWVRLEAWKSGQSWPDDCFTALPAEGLTPLYTAPPQRKPLTEEAAKACGASGNLGPLMQIVRAVERAHKIGEGA